VRFEFQKRKGRRRSESLDVTTAMNTNDSRVLRFDQKQILQTGGEKIWQIDLLKMTNKNKIPFKMFRN
jgi:hypothetical protein